VINKIEANEAPRAVGPYSHAVKYGNLIFCSGQGAINPKTGELVKGTITEQTRITLNNLSAILEAANSDMGHVLKATVYLADISTFDEMNAVYTEFFSDPYPARTTVEVKGIFGGLGVEIDLVAAERSG
jgi:2-iminobutanoate/2-iminopropanoate deaminase